MFRSYHFGPEKMIPLFNHQDQKQVEDGLALVIFFIMNIAILYYNMNRLVVACEQYAQNCPPPPRNLRRGRRL